MKLSERRFGGARFGHRIAACTSLVGVGILALSACSSSSSTASNRSSSSGSSASKSPYVIGLTTDLSGPIAAYGKAEQNAWKAEFDMVNASGGVNGHQIKLVTLDDQTNPATAQANATQLLQQDHVLAIGGSIASSICSQLVATITSHTTPMICNAVDNANLKPVKKYVFDMYDSEVTLAQPELQWTKDHFNARSGLKIVVVDAAVPAEAAWGDLVKQIAPQYGASVVKTIEQSAAAAPDMKTAAAEIAAAKPDVVYIEESGDAIEQLQNNLKTLSASVPLVALDTSYTAFQQSSDPELLFQLNQVSFVDPNGTEPAVKNYVQWMAKQGVSGAAALNPSNGVIYYVAAADIVEALKACGDGCTGSKLADALESSSVDLPGVTNSSGFAYSSSSHLPNKTTAIYQWDPSTKLPKLVADKVPLGDL